MAKIQPKAAPAPVATPKAPVAQGPHARRSAAPVAQATPAAPAGTAKPGEPAPTTEKKGGRIDYPGLKDAAGNEVKLSAVPADFDPKVHKGLGRKHFIDEATFFDYKASRLEHEAAELRKKAEVSRQLGSSAERAKAKRLMAMQKRMEELKAQLSAAGIDVAQLLAAAGGDEAEEAEEAATAEE